MSKTVFISGSRRVARLGYAAKDSLDAIINQGMTVVVGDERGADALMQIYLDLRGYENVTVYHVGEVALYNQGDWPTVAITPPPHATPRGKQTAKDIVMTQIADYGLAIWDMQSQGTIENVVRLLRANKSVRLINVHNDKQLIVHPPYQGIEHIEASIQ